MLATIPPLPLSRTFPHAGAKCATPRPPPTSLLLLLINAHVGYYWTTEGVSKADGANTGTRERRGIFATSQELVVCMAQSEAVPGWWQEVPGGPSSPAAF